MYVYSNICNNNNNNSWDCRYTPMTLNKGFNWRLRSQKCKKCTETCWTAMTWNLCSKLLEYNVNISFWLFFTISRYPAKICRVEASEKKALIHFEGWNHRFDEWISFESERIRPSARAVEPREDKGDKNVQVSAVIFTTVNIICRKLNRLLYYWCDLCNDYTSYLCIYYTHIL